MSGNSGAQFGNVAPRNNAGLLRVGGLSGGSINLGSTQDTLENGYIQQVCPDGSFQPGQQTLFWLTIYNPLVGGRYISRVRLKPWWKRVTVEKRGPGDPGNNMAAGEGWTYSDQAQFGSGPIVAASPTSSVRAENNRLVWFPVPKMLDVTQYQTPPPVVAPDRQSDSLFLDDVWTLDLQDPSDPAYAATRGVDQPAASRSACFLYVSHGYALGLTHQFDLAGQGIGTPELSIDLTWANGTL
jgi:hypothetical protein